MQNAVLDSTVLVSALQQSFPLVTALPSLTGIVRDPNDDMVIATALKAQASDIIANNPIDQKAVELSSSQHYSLVENSMYRPVFPPPGVEDGVFLPSSQRASEAFACHDWSNSRGI